MQGIRWARGSYPSAEKQSVYNTAPADWAMLPSSDPVIVINLYSLSVLSFFF